MKKFLEKRGYEFESETDTEIIAKLIHHLYMQHPNDSFRELVEQAIQQLVKTTSFLLLDVVLSVWSIFQEGAFALAFKSKYFPGECVATRRGSPLLVGIKTKTRLATDHIPILYGKGKSAISLQLRSFVPRFERFCLYDSRDLFIYVVKNECRPMIL